MFAFGGRNKKEESKCYVTHGTMGHLDPKQPPVKRKPFRAVLAVPFVHKAELILPKELYEIIRDDLESRFFVPIYSRVILPLEALLEDDFFNEYIKKGDILMLSEGTHGVDNVYSLKDGVLTLTLDKESYERAGLVGKPDGIKGRRGTRPRWNVEINLRLPSMLYGKKGFNRIVYAFKNVLTAPVTWLFTDLRAQGLSPEPIQKHFPVVISCPPNVSPELKVKMPRLQPPIEPRVAEDDDFSDFSADLYEWLSLISLESPRVDANDRIDPFLSRYSPPNTEPTNSEITELVKVAWNGLLSPSWAHKTLVQVLLAATSQTWFSFAVFGFNDSLSHGSVDCTMLRLPGTPSEYILWEVEQG